MPIKPKPKRWSARTWFDMLRCAQEDGWRLPPVLAKGWYRIHGQEALQLADLLDRMTSGQRRHDWLKDEVQQVRLLRDMLRVDPGQGMILSLRGVQSKAPIRDGRRACKSNTI